MTGWTTELIAERLARLKNAAMPPMKARGRQGHVTGQKNRTEQRFEDEVLAPRKLVGEIDWYSFEPFKLRLAANTSYTPDFCSMSKETREFTFWDVKARRTFKRTDGTSYDGPLVEDDAMVKLKVVAELYPMFKFCMVWRLANGEWAEKIIGG